jgi:hypothetical protein
MAADPEKVSERPAGPRLPRHLDEDAIRHLEGVLGEKFSPFFREAHAAFRRDFLELYPRYRGQWVAYHGAKRLGINRSDIRLYRECERLGLSDDEFLIFNIDPEPFGSHEVTLNG